MVTKTSIRTCVGCGLERPKNGLVRVVRTEESVSIDLEGKKAGRGAYICPMRSCFDAAVKKNSISRSLSVDIGTDRTIEIENDFSKHIDDINGKRRHA